MISSNSNYFEDKLLNNKVVYVIHEHYIKIDDKIVKNSVSPPIITLLGFRDPCQSFSE